MRCRVETSSLHWRAGGVVGSSGEPELLFLEYVGVLLVRGGAGASFDVGVLGRSRLPLPEANGLLDRGIGSVPTRTDCARLLGELGRGAGHVVDGFVTGDSRDFMHWSSRMEVESREDC